MAGQIYETPRSREQQVGFDNPDGVYDCHIIGEDDDTAARALVEGFLPAFITTSNGTLKFQYYKMRPLGGGQWEVMGRYGRKETTRSFDTTGGTTKIQKSLKTVASYAAAGVTPPDHKGAVNVQDTRIEGTEIPTPAFHFGITLYVDPALVDDNVQDLWASLTGKVNDGFFLGGDEGEVIFLGVSGSQKGIDDYELTFKFAKQKTRQNIPIGKVGDADPLYTVDEVKGWDFLWTEYEDSEDATANALVKVPLASHVEQVSERDDLSQIFTIIGYDENGNPPP